MSMCLEESIVDKIVLYTLCPVRIHVWSINIPPIGQQRCLVV